MFIVLFLCGSYGLNRALQTHYPIIHHLEEATPLGVRQRVGAVKHRVKLLVPVLHTISYMDQTCRHTWNKQSAILTNQLIDRPAGILTIQLTDRPAGILTIQLTDWPTKWWSNNYLTTDQLVDQAGNFHKSNSPGINMFMTGQVKTFFTCPVDKCLLLCHAIWSQWATD